MAHDHQEDPATTASSSPCTCTAVNCTKGTEWQGTLDRVARDPEIHQTILHLSPAKQIFVLLTNICKPRGVERRYSRVLEPLVHTFTKCIAGRRPGPACAAHVARMPADAMLNAAREAESPKQKCQQKAAAADVHVRTYH